jgi:hypothetical protein
MMKTHSSRGFNRSALLIASSMLWGVAEFIALQFSLLREFLTRKH